MQDLVVIVFLILVTGVTLRGITRPAHLSTHALLLVTSLMTPFVAFRWDALAQVPWQALALCGAFIGVQLAHTGFHLVRPAAPHREGPEILFQSLVPLWTVAVVPMVDPTLWYRGELGTFLFCFELVFVSMAVLMTIYMGGLTERVDDEIDFLKYTLRSPSNSGFLAASMAGLGATAFAAFGDPVWLLAAVAGFVAVKLALPPSPAPVLR